MVTCDPADVSLPTSAINTHPHVKSVARASRIKEVHEDQSENCRAQAVPGRDDETPLIAVSRSGFATDGLDAAFGPEELIEAWAPPPR
jgi:hypothetical protein